MESVASIKCTLIISQTQDVTNEVRVVASPVLIALCVSSCETVVELK